MSTTPSSSICTRSKTTTGKSCGPKIITPNSGIKPTPNQTCINMSTPSSFIRTRSKTTTGNFCGPKIILPNSGIKPTPNPPRKAPTLPRKATAAKKSSDVIDLSDFPAFKPYGFTEDYPLSDELKKRIKKSGSKYLSLVSLPGEPRIDPAHFECLKSTPPAKKRPSSKIIRKSPTAKAVVKPATRRKSHSTITRSASPITKAVEKLPTRRKSHSTVTMLGPPVEVFPESYDPFECLGLPSEFESRVAITTPKRSRRAPVHVDHESIAVRRGKRITKPIVRFG